MALDKLTSDMITAGAVNAAAIADGTVVAAEIADDAITTAKLADDAITGAKIADDVINSEHLVDGGVDDAHLATGISASKLTGALPAISGAALTGLAAFPSGTKMVFYQASAPTGWTKDTTSSLANRALRIVVGSGGGTGGTHDLNSPPSLAHTHTGPSHTHTGPSHTHSHSLSAGAHTLTTAQMPAHTHLAVTKYSEGGSAPGIWFPDWGWSGKGSESYNHEDVTSGSTGGGGSHSHSLSGSISAGGTGTTGASGTGATGSTTPTAFAPKYVDVIIASKD